LQYASLTVSIRPVSFPEEGERLLTARVYSSTYFKVPPGFLRSGRVYYANISAYRGDNDVLDRPVFRLGTPSHQTDCVMGLSRPELQTTGRIGEVGKTPAALEVDLIDVATVEVLLKHNRVDTVGPYVRIGT